jgi:hypothetical protein
MTDQRPKDPMTTFRSTIRGKNSKGGDRFQLYLTPEMASQIATLITDQNVGEKGVKLDLHISKKTASDTGREFDSAIVFVKTTQESSMGGGARGGAVSYSPKPNGAASAAAALKGAQVKA